MTADLFQQAEIRDMLLISHIKLATSKNCNETSEVRTLAALQSIASSQQAIAVMTYWQWKVNE